MTEAMLELEEYGVAFGERIILSSVSLTVPEKGIVILMGPSGTGKSTLLRSVSGISASSPYFRSWGKAQYLGRDLGEIELPVLVSQSASLLMSSVLENVVHALPERHTLTQAQQRELAQRLLANAGLDELAEALDQRVVDLTTGQQRLLATLGQVAAGPRLLCIDEPTTGVNEEDAQRILTFLKKEAERRAIFIVLHNQQQAKQLGGTTVLLAGGWVQEAQPTSQFFGSPKSEAGISFAKTGTCCMPSPNTKPEEIDPYASIALKPVPDAARQYKSAFLGPRGFLWLKKGRLAGTPFPGIVADLDDDLEALQRVGVTHLVSLTERKLNTDDLVPYNMSVIRSYIPDMGAPSFEQASEICTQIAQLLQQNEVVAVHCRAGLGRTGTTLASQLIWEGSTALNALDTVRKIEPRWVQSEVQINFLESFEKYVNEFKCNNPNAEAEIRRTSIY